MIKTYEIDFDDALVSNAEEIFKTLGTDIDTAIHIFLKQVVLRKGFPFEIVVPEKNENHSTADILEREEISDSRDIHSGITEEEENAAGVALPSSEAAFSSVSPEIAARVAANEALVEEMRAEIGDKNITPEFDEGEEEKIANEASDSLENVSATNVESEPALSGTEDAESQENAVEESSSDEISETADVAEEKPCFIEEKSPDEDISSETDARAEPPLPEEQASDSEALSENESDETGKKDAFGEENPSEGEPCQSEAENPVADETAPSGAESTENAESQENAETENDDSEDEDETTPENLFDAWDVGEEENIGCR